VTRTEIMTFKSEMRRGERDEATEKRRRLAQLQKQKEKMELEITTLMQELGELGE